MCLKVLVYDGFGIWLAAQIAYKVLVETQTLCARTPLCVENACNDCIGIVLRQPSHEGKRIFVGANRSGSRTRQRDVTLGELAAAPAQLQMCPILFSMNSNTDFLERKRCVFLAITHISKRITVSIRQVAQCRSVYRCHRQCAKARLFHARY